MLLLLLERQLLPPLAHELLLPQVLQLGVGLAALVTQIPSTRWTLALCSVASCGSPASAAELPAAEVAVTIELRRRANGMVKGCTRNRCSTCDACR